MELNVETAVRISPFPPGNGDVICVNSNCYNNSVVLGNAHTYPVNYALPPKCSQNTVFATAISPLINYFFEACDVSVVTFGQNGMGKSYTLLGPGLSCAMSECEQGVIPRFLREVFLRLSQNVEKNFTVHITWSQICGENVQDLLGAGSVEISNVSDAFQLIQLGMTNLAPRCAHTLFTITLEQQFLIDSMVQHRVSTASFADLSGSEKMLVIDQTGVTQSIPTDPGLLALQRCVISLTEPYNSQCTVPNIPYNQSALTTLLKDSFGGRAKTVLLCCISPYLRDLSETFYTMQFALRAQMIKNMVTVNSYTTYESAPDNLDVFGLQFAANQLFKLVSNAEELFQKLATNGSVSKTDLEQITQWLTLKQECEDCLSENSEPRRSLDIIQEEIEDDSTTSESDIEEPAVSEQKIGKIISIMQKETDELVSKQLNLPKTTNTKQNTSVTPSEFHQKGARGRRASIHSVGDLSSIVSSSANSIEQKQHLEQSLGEDDKDKDNQNFESKKRALKSVIAEVEGCERQMLELEHTITIKEKLMQQLLKHKNVKVSAKEKIEQKCAKLRSDYHNAKSKAIQAQVQNDQQNGEKLKMEVAEIQEKLKDMLSIKGITDDSEHRLVELENSLHTSRKQLEKLRKLRKKEEKRKLSIEKQLKEINKSLDSKKSTNSSKLTKSSSIKSIVSFVSTKKLEEESLETLRHEIRNLRKTRELLLDQKTQIDAKNKKLLNDVDERKLIQYEEAVEAIDLAIEFKNEMLCGRDHLYKENDKVSKSESDKMLFERLLNLNDDEMRVLLQKYFEKVVDLRSNSKKLELQVVDMECQNDNLASRVQSLSHTLQQVRLQTERRIVSLQQQHEDKLQVVLQYLAGDERRLPSVLKKPSKPLSLQISGSRNQQVFTQISRHTGLPRELQLQSSSTQPQAKVTKQKNKLIIQQKSK